MFFGDACQYGWFRNCYSIETPKNFVCIHSSENAVFHYISTEDYHGGLKDVK